MNLKAAVDQKFIMRFLIISLGCFGLMIWGLYDAVVAYPAEFERAKFFASLATQVEDGSLSEEQRKEQWEEKCKAENWSIMKPDSPENAEQDVYVQWVLFGIGLVGGVFFLIKYLRLRTSWVEADEKSVKTSWGQELKFDSIAEINKAKWAKKGIAKVSYHDDSGKSRIMVFDDFKYHRETMGKILRLAEKGLKDDQIVNGTRESEESPQEEITTIDDDD